MSKPSPVVPFSLKDTPALIEHALPVQRLSIESYKEQMAGAGKTLTALGSYWKGRKPLILNKACILGCLLPATDDLVKDLEVFELLMAMDDESLRKRLALKPGVPLPAASYRDLVTHKTYDAWRPEEIHETVHTHIWAAVNAHLGTSAHSFPELVEQLGVMRFGHRPKVADTFCGSGQIPFEAARLGCDVYASDLNPIACMLTWGAFHIVGGSKEERAKLETEQKRLVATVQAEIDALGVEEDGHGWRAKVFLYCIETRCPSSGWMVPMLPTRVISTSRKVIAELVPDAKGKRYDIVIRPAVDDAELEASSTGTVQEEALVHVVDGREHRTPITTIRGDYTRPDGTKANRLRMWELSDVVPRPGDIYQERLYAIQWMKARASGKSYDYEFRSVTNADLQREATVLAYVQRHLAEWQAAGWAPDMRIEPGEETARLLRERGWVYWHHLFNPRQILLSHLAIKNRGWTGAFSLTKLADNCSRLARWNGSGSKGAGGNTSNTFDNQALNPNWNFAHRGFGNCQRLLDLPSLGSVDVSPANQQVSTVAASKLEAAADIFVTDPPYGDAVVYHEILEFFIAWLRKNPPHEFADWTWDSRRALAIKGDGDDFKRSMVAAYKRMTDCMPDNGLQVVMFTHQSGEVWADMANIVWASGLRVTAAWYVVTETNNALRGIDSNHVKGTVLLVLRKRTESLRGSRLDLGWELKEEVEKQVEALTGLNQRTRALHRDENLFADADLQMAGYAAALRVLTQYAVIDGKEMAVEAMHPRVAGRKTFVDELIGFAVDEANKALVPSGLAKAHWGRVSGVERFYLKMLDLESGDIHSLDNYQNFARAFGLRDYRPLMASSKANKARLKGAMELGSTQMDGAAEFAGKPLRAVLYALMELERGLDGGDVLKHLEANLPEFFQQATRMLVVDLAAYLAPRLEPMRPKEASAARVLGELVRNQRL